QTVYTEALESAPGSVAQVRECAAQLTRFAKQSAITVILVGHVTKEGAIAGPRVLEHIVDTVLYFEGDTHSSFRLVRAIKNRFGAANELGVFAMTERGLKGVSNPSALFLSQHATAVPGSCILATMEGSRPPAVSRAASRWVSMRSGCPCCWPCCIAMGAWKRASSTSSSMPSAVCVSASRQPTSPCLPQSIHLSKTLPYRINLWYLARSGWRGKSARSSAARNGCARPPSWASGGPSSPMPTDPSRRSTASRS